MRTSLLVGLVFVSLLGCSASTYDYQPCSTNSDCRAAFGIGAVCGGEGLCALSEANPRCWSYPDDVFSAPELYSNAFLFGAIFDDGALPWMARATRLAVKQVNDNAGLDGRDIALVLCDNAPDSSIDDLDHNGATEETGTYLVQTLGVPAVVGPATSTRAEIAYNTVNPLGALVISPSATSVSLTDLDGLSASDEDPGLFWRTAPPDDLQGAVMASHAYDTLGTRNLAIIHENGAYGEGLAAVVQASFQGAVTLFPFTSTTDIDQAVADVADEGNSFDGVAFISSEVSEIVYFFNAAGAVPFFHPPEPAVGVDLLLADGAFDIAILDGTSEDAQLLFQHVSGTRPAVPGGTIYNAFAAGYAGEYPGDSADDFAFSAHTYDAAWLAIYGMTWAFNQAEEVSGIEMARGLRHLSSGDDVEIRPTTWNTVKANFAAGNSVNVEGASGPLDYDPDTGETSANIDLWRIVEDGAGGYDFDVFDCVDPNGDPCP